LALAEFGVLALRQAWDLRFELADFQQRQKAGQQGATASMPGYARNEVGGAPKFRLSPSAPRTRPHRPQHMFRERLKEAEFR